MQIRERYPAIGVLVLSQYVELGLAMQLLSESPEGVGYLLKDRVADVAEFVERGAAGRRRRVGHRSLDRLPAARPACEGTASSRSSPRASARCSR